MSKKGILLVNLGSPDSPSVKDVRRYLAQFLMDERVIDAPLLIRFLIVYGLILPTRPKRSAEAYATIWTEDGSPLIHTTQCQLSLLKERLEEVPMAIGMRYGNPSIRAGLNSIMDQTLGEVEDILLIPLYPHYAMSSFETVVVEARKQLDLIAPQVKLTVQPPFFQHKAYIKALSASIKPHLKDPYDHILFSYHGIPERHLHKTDPTGRHCLSNGSCCDDPNPVLDRCYRAQVFRTTALVTQALKLESEKVSVSFQSRLGKDPWLLPFTDHVLKELPNSGVKRLVIISPAFVSDCLETIEELGEEGKDIFMEAGGESYTLVPCLNTHSKWIDTLHGFCSDFLSV